jgi:hypothetical protein
MVWKWADMFVNALKITEERYIITTSGKNPSKFPKSIQQK